jgi:hypothetical protein
MSRIRNDPAAVTSITLLMGSGAEHTGIPSRTLHEGLLSTAAQSCARLTSRTYRPLTLDAAREGK